MATKQTRRSISVSISLYERLKAKCDADNHSMSGVVESEIRKYLGMEPRDLTPKHPVRQVAEVVLTTKELKAAPAPISWKPASEDRVATIRAEAEKQKAAPPPPGDKASKIFTF
jgi:hypothetical protein